jgi:hypothetical protein
MLLQRSCNATLLPTPLDTATATQRSYNAPATLLQHSSNALANAPAIYNNGLTPGLSEICPRSSEATALLQRSVPAPATLLQRSLTLQAAKMLQEYCKNVAKMLQQCCKNVAKMYPRLQTCCKSVAKMLQKCCKNASEVTKILQKCTRNLP